MLIPERHREAGRGGQGPFPRVFGGARPGCHLDLKLLASRTETEQDFCCFKTLVCAQSLQLCLTLSNPRDCGSPGSSVPLSVGFSRQEYWSGLPCPPPGDLPDPGIMSHLHCRRILYHEGHLGSPLKIPSLT